MPADGIFNPKDPLLRSGRERELELFKQFTRIAHGRANDDVIGAAANLIVNGLRQGHSSRAAALKAFDDFFALMKSRLDGHYNGNGRVKGVFPYHQVIEVPLLPFSMHD